MQDSRGLVSRYLDHCRRRYAATTTTRRAQVLHRLLEAEGDLLALDADAIETWLDRLTITPRTRNCYLSDLSGFYRWAVRHEHLTRDPIALTTRGRPARCLPRPVPGPDLATVLDGADPRMRAWLCLMAYGGLRCCEVAGLDAEHLLWHLDPPQVHVTGKGGHERLVPLALVAEQALRDYGLPRRGPVFTHTDGRRVTPKYVSNRTCRHFHELGVASTAHACRHFFGTAAYQGTGKDLRAVMELMGHRDPETTTVYVAWVQSDAADVVRGLGSES